MCRDYNPQHSECGLALAKLLLNHSQLDAALAELQVVLRLPQLDRPMLTHFRHWQCDIPAVLASAYATKGAVAAGNGALPLTPQEAMYMLLAVSNVLEHHLVELIYTIFLYHAYCVSEYMLCSTIPSMLHPRRPV